MRLLLLIDYDNLTQPQKAAGILAVVTRALLQIELGNPKDRSGCLVRLYGGWYEGTMMTALAQRVATEIQQDFPAIIRVPSRDTEIIPISVSCELAVGLLEDPSRLLFNTFRKKRRPANLKVQSPVDVGCLASACPLSIAAQLLSTGRCETTGCTIVADDLVYRNEQKIVDTMLSCDVTYATSLAYDHILIISGDDDFLPPIATAVCRGASVFRFRPKPNSPGFALTYSLNKLVEMDL